MEKLRNKTQIKLLSGMLALTIVSYFTWVSWQRPAIIEWDVRIDDETKKVVKNYLKENPPSKIPLTKDQFLSNFINPHDIPRNTVIVVQMMYLSRGSNVGIEFIEIIDENKPEKIVSIRCLEDGSWEKVNLQEEIPDDAIPLVGRMFGERTKE